MSNKEIEYDTDAEVLVYGSVTKAVRGRGPSFSDGGYPDEPSEVEDLRVSVIVYGQTIDVTSLLSKKTLGRFEETILVEAYERYDADDRYNEDEHDR